MGEVRSAAEKAAQLRFDEARALRAQARPIEALAAYDAALSLAPDDPILLYNRGFVLLDVGRYAQALASFDQAIAIDPGAARAWYGRGVALMALDRPEDALPSFEAAVRGDLGYADAHSWRGLALLRLGRPEEAADSLRVALTIKPDDAAIGGNYRTALMRAGRVGEALADAERAVQRNPRSADSRFTRALPLLMLGRFREGWEDYEHRWDAQAFARPLPELAARLTRRPMASDILGQRVLLFGEQGVGDVLMFASMIPDAQRDAAQLACLCDGRLVRLLSHSFPDVRFLASSDVPIPLAEFDRAVGLGSLGRLYRRELSDFPGTPYLRPTPGGCSRWSERLGPRNGRLRVGLSWRGGVQITGSLGRSMPLAQLAPLLHRADCEFVSLQYGDVGPEVDAVNATLPRPIRRFPAAEIEDFDDLAALVQQLDVVVSVQTAVVHLSGALGERCLVMLPAAAEWRYGASGEALPWYNSVRLFRQGDDRSWEPVVRRIGLELQSISF